MTPIRRAIALLLQHPQLGPVAVQVKPDWRRLRQPGIALLTDLLDLTQIQPNLTTAALIERWRDTEHFSGLNRLAEHDLSEARAAPQEELFGALRRLNECIREQEMEALFNKSRPSDLTDQEKDRLKRLLSRTGAAIGEHG